MSDVDYNKIFYAAASALDASANVTVEALDLDTYTAGITLENGSLLTLTAVSGEYSIELSLAKESLKRREYIKFLSRFEYNLEQKFFKNIKFESREMSGEYRIKISF